MESNLLFATELSREIYLLDEVNITCNKNAIPNDPQSPFVTSGVRLGTAAVTSRGMKPEDMDKIEVDRIVFVATLDAPAVDALLDQGNALLGER